MLQLENNLYVPAHVDLQNMLIIYVWKSNIWYNNKPKIIKRLKLHLAFLMVYFILYKQLKMAFFLRQKRVSGGELLCHAETKYRGRFGFKHP